MKVYELAKELNIENKTLLEYLAKEGCHLKSHMNVVSDKLADRAREYFAKKSNHPSQGMGIKAIALPEKFEKMVEADRAKEQTEEKASAVLDTKKKESEQQDDSTKKKKKIVGVFNPQYSTSLKGIPNKKDTEQAPVSQKAAPKKTYIPARDRKPDDYVEPVKDNDAVEGTTNAVSADEKKTAASTSQNACDLSPEKEDLIKTEENAAMQETVKKEPAQNEAAPIEPKKSEIKENEKNDEIKTEIKETDEKNKTEKKSDNLKKKESAGETSSENAKTDNAKKQHADKKLTEKKNEAKAKAQAQLKAETRNPMESEAIKSLRAKIVKGTINPDELLNSSKPARRGDESGQQRQSSGNRYNQNQGKGRGNWSQSSQSGRGQANSGSGYNKDAENDNNNKGRQSVGRKNNNNNHAGAAPMPADVKGKGKASKQSKDKYDKNKKGDKFDRLENEKAAMRTSKQPVKPKQEEEVIKVIQIPEQIELREFAEKLKMQPAALIKEQFLKGRMYTVNDVLDFETAEEIALEKDIICEKEVEVDNIAELLKEEEDPEETLVKRPPVVCIMGHVDHGKTSLLDAIRKTNVTAGEAGGITQHIGAYTVSINGESITFLDTPGHEAFTAMRLRGAQATDVAILVVAADDGVKPQTIEAINHAKAAGIHVIVAVNKIDKPGANVDKVKQELSELGIVAEDWGGDTIFVPVSAKTGEGISSLLEMVILDTEILELRANPNRKARGVVIEARLDKGRGSVATLLVQKGTLKTGDHIAIGEAYGKVRSMTNEKGQKLKQAGPSTPVEITGLSAVPVAGETFVAFDTDKEAKQFAQVYVTENKKKLLAGAKAHVSLTDMFDQMKAGELKELNIIVKADVQGTVEALKESLEKLSNDEIVVKCIHTGAGNVTINDATLASASNAIIIAFNVGANPDARDLIEHEKIDLRTYDIIYNAIDDITAAMQGMYEPVYEEVVIGHVEIRQTFKASGVGIIAGSYVTDGIVKKNASARLTRDGEQLFDGQISSLKRFSDDAKEVKAGFECGIVLKDFQDIKEGDMLEIYEMKEVPRK